MSDQQEVGGSRHGQGHGFCQADMGPLPIRWMMNGTLSSDHACMLTCWWRFLQSRQRKVSPNEHSKQFESNTRCLCIFVQGMCQAVRSGLTGCCCARPALLMLWCQQQVSQQLPSSNGSSYITHSNFKFWSLPQRPGMLPVRLLVAARSA